jgi:1-acyl-sn-glycerol-3-phosphate acyltransferase
MKTRKALASQYTASPVAQAHSRAYVAPRAKIAPRGLFWVKLTWVLTYFLCFPITRIFQHVKITIDDSFFDYDFRPDRPLVIISNHKSVFDPWLISNVIPFKTFLKILPIRIMGSVTFVDRIAHFFDKVGLVKIIYFLYGVVPFEKEWTFEQKLAPLIDCLKQGERVMIFPEGGLNRAAGIKPFRRGLIYMHKEFGMDILPIAINPKKETGRQTSVTIGTPFKIPAEILASENPNDEFYTKSCEFARGKVEELYQREN